MFFFVAPSPRAHLDILGRLGRMLRRGPVRDLVLANAPDDAILKAVADADASTTGVPQAEPG
jgi:PTS system nitrogen regulatory IIA component